MKEIVVKNGRATGVKLADGKVIKAANSSPAPSIFRHRCGMAGENFPRAVRKKRNSWHWGNHSL